MSNTIFYFTGTGNSLKIAKDIAEKSDLLNCSIVSIAKNMANVQSLKPENAVGFIFPVYYWGIPQIVNDFLEKIDLSNASYTYIIASHGAAGGNGGCVHQVKNILSKKGVKLNAGFYIKAVDNFILWRLGIPPIEKQEKIHKTADNRIANVAEYISGRLNHFDKSCMEYIGPVIFGYKKFITNNRWDKLFYADSNCNSCGICTKVCPVYNVELNNGKPEWKSKYCQKCLACLHLCPTKSIEYGKVTKNRRRYKNPYITMEELYN